MNSKDRFLAAIANKPIDRVPVAPFVMAFAAKYAGINYGKYCSDYKKMAEAQTRTVTDFEYDIVTVDTDPYREAEACGAKLEFPEDGLPLEIEPALREKKDFLQWKLPVIDLSPRLLDKVLGVGELKRQLKEEYPVLGWVEAPFQSASLLRNINYFMLDLYDDPAFVQELLNFTTEMALMYGEAQAKAGADIIGVGDAVASLISPPTYAKFVLPHTARLVKGLQSFGVKVKYHICGQSSHLLEQIAQLGVDMVNIDHQVDLASARVIFKDICVKGNLDPVGVLKDGTPESITNAVHQTIKIGGTGYVLSPGCEVPVATPYDNFRAMIQAVR